MKEHKLLREKLPQKFEAALDEKIEAGWASVGGIEVNDGWYSILLSRKKPVQEKAADAEPAAE